MWPKVFAQLVELLPHVHRLIPVADKYFASRTSNDRLIEGSLVSSGQGDFGAGNAPLYRQLQDQGAQIAEVAVEARSIRVAVEVSSERIMVLEKQMATMGVWIKACVGLLAIVLGILVALLLRAH